MRHGRRAGHEACGRRGGGWQELSSSHGCPVCGLWAQGRWLVYHPLVYYAWIFQPHESRCVMTGPGADRCRLDKARVEVGPGALPWLTAAGARVGLMPMAGARVGWAMGPGLLHHSRWVGSSPSGPGILPGVPLPLLRLSCLGPPPGPRTAQQGRATGLTCCRAWLGAGGGAVARSRRMARHAARPFSGEGRANGGLATCMLPAPGSSRVSGPSSRVPLRVASVCPSG